MTKNKVNKTKGDYHNACKAEKTAINQERNASGDSSLSPDQVSSAHVSVVFVFRHLDLLLILLLIPKITYVIRKTLETRLLSKETPLSRLEKSVILLWKGKFIGYTTPHIPDIAQQPKAEN